MTGDSIYLDYAASTPLAPEVLEAMVAASGPGGVFANPSSVHAEGRRSARAVAEARGQLGRLIGADPDCLIFTSGATESDNLAIRGAAYARANRGRHLVTMPTEHKAVTDTFHSLEKEGFEVTWIHPGADGLLHPGDLVGALRDDTQLVSVMHVNNEIGVIQDIAAIGRVCREREILFHTDAAQSTGKLPIDLSTLPVDLLSLTGHKFYGPKGIGALYVADRPGGNLMPILYGGGQEKRLRPGTLPVPLIVGLGVAAEVARQQADDDYRHISVLSRRFLNGLSEVADLTFNSSAQQGYPGIINVSAGGVEGESLMLAMEPLCVASGSACNSTNAAPSYVLRALGRTDVDAQGAVRFSFGRTTTEAEVDRALGIFKAAVGKIRQIADGA